jgi:hypothetical protein
MKDNGTPLSPSRQTTQRPDAVLFVFLFVFIGEAMPERLEGDQVDYIWIYLAV